MRAYRAGFTLIELMVATVLTAAIVGAVYQTLRAQERSYVAAGAHLRDQESLRSAIGVLEAELREIGSIGGGAIGGTDIRVASPDSIVFRAQRTIGFTCKLDEDEHSLLVWSLGDPFDAGGVEGDPADEVLLFVDGDSLRCTDDHWDRARIATASHASDDECEAAWPGVPQQVLELTALDLDGRPIGMHTLAGVQVGGPVRAYDRVTYTLQESSSDGWSLARRRDGEPARHLIGGLAPPGEGLRLGYYTPDGVPTTDPAQVSRVEITVRTRPTTTTGLGFSSMSTTVHLRNNSGRPEARAGSPR